jgi:hypothetical protein
MRVIFILVIAASITFNCASSQKLSKENEIFLNSKISFKFTDEELKGKEFMKNRPHIAKLLNEQTFIEKFNEKLLLEFEKQLNDEKVKLLLSESNVTITINEVTWNWKEPIELSNYKKYLFFWYFYSVEWIVRIDYKLNYNQCEMDFSFQNKTGNKKYKVFYIERLKGGFLLIALASNHQYIVGVPLILFSFLMAVNYFGDGAMSGDAFSDDKNLLVILTKASNKELIQEMLDNFEIVKSTCAEKKGNIK